MTLRVSRPVSSTIALLMIGFVAGGCGDNNGSPAQPTNTPAPAATATPTHQAGNVSGLLVLNRNVTVGTSDALGAPPQQWMESKDSASFDRSLAAADWSIDGGAVSQGVTGPDGRFVTGGLPPGPHTLQIAKTLDGNLASVSVPFTVGDDGGADVVVEVAWGQVKSAVTYTRAGAQVREVRAPNGNWLTERDGHITAFGDSVRTFVDSTGSGTFVLTPCVSNGLPPPQPYACNADGSCAQPDDSCVCIASCPVCDDCPKRVCVPSCPPVEVVAITVSGTSQLIVGEQGSVTATAQLSDGGSFDTTSLVDWAVNDPSIANIDSWGTVTALQVGSTAITASFGNLTSTPWPVQITARPALQAITLQNVSCLFPMGSSTAGGALPASAAPPPSSDVLPAPNCKQVVEIGATIQFRAIGQFGDNYYQDITGEVQWQVAPAAVATVVNGLFTAQQAGTASITAVLDGVVSPAADVRVVTQPTVVALTIYADTGGFPLMGSGVGTGKAAPPPVASGMPCMIAMPAASPGMTPCCCPGPLANGGPCRCAYSITVLSGDQLQFHATAQYDTGTWKDVTADVTWMSSQPAVAGIAAGGVMTALQAGDTDITATLDTVTSDPTSMHVVDHATLQSIWIYEEPGQDTVVAKGDQRFFHAIGSYDVGISREITTDAAWHSSDESVGGFDTPGVFTGRAAGMVQVWAELNGQQSNQLSLEVFETSELTYCDPNNINRAVWSDDFNRVILESDCASYSQPGVARLRYTVTEIQPHGGIFNPCLDLYVFTGKTPVRTIREEGCGQPFLAANAPGVDQEKLKYQLLAFWDLKDDGGNPVPLGDYTIYGRFYLYYDPVVSLDVTVLAPGQATPTPEPITPLPTASVTPAAVCTPPACPAGTALVCAKGGGASGNVGGGLGCCPSGWDLHPCTSANGQKGLACHNPALGCASSGVCGEGCDPVVTGTCDGCSDGCGYICVSGTPPPPEVTPITPAPVCTPPPCPTGAVLNCPGDCAGGCGYVCVPGPVCTLPPCPPGGFLDCAGFCAGGCGYVCRQFPTPTPPPPIEGACFKGSSQCASVSSLTSQRECCLLAQGLGPEAISWCPIGQLDPSTGACGACGDPCEGLQTPTTTPLP